MIRIISGKAEINSFRFESGNVRLSVRETQVLAGIILGMTAKQMGEILCLSSRTVEYYIDKLRYKFNGLCRYKMVAFALANGFPVHKFLQAFRQTRTVGEGK